jgi:hypothetical protein
MSRPFRALPKTITRRWASAAVVEALGAFDLSEAFFAGGGALLDAREYKAFRAVLRSRPEPGGPGMTVVGPLLTTTAVRYRKPPTVPEFKSTKSMVKLARVAEHAGAVSIGGKPREQPRGSVDHYLSAFSALAMLTMAPDPPDAVPPMQRPGSGRMGGRPAPLDVRATLRILVGLVKRCRPERGAVTPAVCVALMVWLEGHRRPRHRDPNRPWPFTLLHHGPVKARGGGRHRDPNQPGPFTTAPNRFALRKADGSYREKDILPLVEETEPWIVTGPSIGLLAKAIQDFMASKDGEYGDYVKPLRRQRPSKRSPRRREAT